MYENIKQLKLHETRKMLAKKLFSEKEENKILALARVLMGNIIFYVLCFMLIVAVARLH